MSCNPKDIQDGKELRMANTPAMHDWQWHIKEALEGILPRHLDTLALSILQPLQTELKGLVSLLTNQHSSAYLAATAASEKSSGQSSTRLRYSQPLQDRALMQDLSESTVNDSHQYQPHHQLQQDPGPATPQCEAGSTDNRVKQNSSFENQKKSEAYSRQLRKKRVLKIASHRIILTEPVMPLRRSGAQPILFDWPDSAAASRTTAAASEVWSDNQLQLHNLDQPTNLKAGVCSGLARVGEKRINQSARPDLLSLGGVASPSSRSPVHHRRSSCSLQPTRAQIVKASDTCSWHSPQVRDTSCKPEAEIVMAAAAPADQAGYAAPGASSRNRYNRSYLTNSLQKSPAEADLPCTSPGT